MALIDRTVEGGLLRGVERADGLDQALDIVTARNRTAQDGPSQFGVIGKIIEEWVLFLRCCPSCRFSGRRDFWGGGVSAIQNSIPTLRNIVCNCTSSNEPWNPDVVSLLLCLSNAEVRT
ncbi:hypothetical protein ACOJBM_34555 [Rhizobium beringeri]